MIKLAETNKKKLGKFLPTILFFIAVYGIMLIKHFSADSYRYYSNPIRNNGGNLGLGRFGDFFVNKLICYFGINYVKHQFWFILILILVIVFSVEVIYNHFQGLYFGKLEKRQQFLLKSSIILMFCNVFILEWFIYVEMAFLWGLSLIFMDLALLQIKRQFKLKNMILSIIYLVISVGFYQATISYYVIFALFATYIIYRGKLNKASFMSSIRVIICGGLGGGSNLIFIKLMQLGGFVKSTNRTGHISLESLMKNVNQILESIRNWLIDSYGLLPRYCLIVSISIVYAILLVWIISKKKRSEFIYILLLVITCNFIVYIPHLMTSTVWMAQRTIVSFFIALSLPCMIISIQDTKVSEQRICTFILLGFLIVSIGKMQEISVNVISSNKIDEEISYIINNRIKEYENDTKVKIENISIINDVSPSWGYRSIDYVCLDTNLRAYVVGWGGVDCINYYNETNYKSADMDSEIYKKFFNNKNWDYLDLDEQMVFSGNTLYMVSY